MDRDQVQDDLDTKCEAEEYELDAAGCALAELVNEEGKKLYQRLLNSKAADRYREALKKAGVVGPYQDEIVRIIHGNIRWQ